jgi:hypothetical protein
MSNVKNAPSATLETAARTDFSPRQIETARDRERVAMAEELYSAKIRVWPEHSLNRHALYSSRRRWEVASMSTQSSSV